MIQKNKWKKVNREREKNTRLGKREMPLKWKPTQLAQKEVRSPDIENQPNKVRHLQGKKNIKDASIHESQYLHI